MSNSVVRMSFWDVYYLTQHLVELEHPFDLLKDEVINSIHPFLYENGFDTSRQIAVMACKHRSISKGVVVGYTLLGWQRRDAEWRADKRSTLHHHQDQIGWKRDSIDYTEDLALDDLKPDPRSDVEEDYYIVKQQLKLLTEIQQSVRGFRDVVF